jgi:D-cysteine desulfhydrase
VKSDVAINSSMTTRDQSRAAPLATRLPLLERFPALNSVPRTALGNYPSPVEHVQLGPGALWVKRDDLNAPAYAGNKVRALEFLLGGVREGDLLVTAGGQGSTHVLAVAALGARIGARTRAVRWRHEMNPIAREVDRAATTLCEQTWLSANGGVAIARARLMAWSLHGRWIPIGGSAPLGMLGHVNAALELGEQVRGGLLPLPSYVIVPLGTGGTAAGLALGFAIAGVNTILVGARVAPPITATGAWVRHLMRRCAALIERLTGERVTRPARDRFVVAHDVYGGAYGRPLPVARETAACYQRVISGGAQLDESYGAKALLHACRLVGREDGPVLFWSTFDGRWREALEEPSGS